MVPLFNRLQSRGGTPAILLAQDDLESILGMAAFAGQATVSMDALSTKPVDVELSSTQFKVLWEMLGWPGQNPSAARILAAVLRRLPPPEN